MSERVWYAVAEHYPSRSQNAIDGDWPGLANGRWYSTRERAEKALVSRIRVDKRWMSFPPDPANYFIVEIRASEANDQQVPES